MNAFLNLGKLLSDWVNGRAPAPASVRNAPAEARTPSLSAAKARRPAEAPLPLHAEALTFESARVGLALESERKAWRAVKGLSVLLALESAAIALMMPLKTTVPYVIEVDRETGAASILEAAQGTPLPASDIQDKYWLSQYVLARESYDYRTLENDYIKVRELSLPQVFEPYASQFGDKADSLEKRLGDAKQHRIELISVVPNGNGIATVRFRKTVRNTASGLIESESRWTATLGYEYRPQKKAPESTRLVNPFGFRVTSYRSDEEIGKDAGKAGGTQAAGGAPEARALAPDQTPAPAPSEAPAAAPAPAGSRGQAIAREEAAS